MKPRWVGVAMAFVAMMVVTLHTPAATQTASPGVYIALGDSIAAGVGSSLPAERSYPSIVHRLLERSTGATVPYDNLAVPGETAATFLSDGQAERFTAAIDRARTNSLPVAAISLTLGGNELLSLQGDGVSNREAGLDTFTTNYDRVLALVRSAAGADVRIVVTTYYDLSRGDSSLQGTDAWWIERFNAVIRDTAGRYGAAIADVEAAFAGEIATLTLAPVDVHPTNAGHVAIARLVWQAFAFDSEAPTIEAPERIEATRDTPTLAFSVSDASGDVTVTLELDSATATPPFAVTENRYVSLIDLTAVSGHTSSVDIVATDAAGNIARTRVEIVRIDSVDGKDTP